MSKRSRKREAGVGTSGDDNIGLRRPPAESSAVDEIVARSDDVRREWECPVCLQLDCGTLLCRCPNRHAVCDACLARLMNANRRGGCPMCREPFVDTAATRAVTHGLARAAQTAMVACSHRRNGCPELFAVREVTAHEESECRYRHPNARCRVPECQWIGFPHNVFDHVSDAHPSFVIDLQVKRHVLISMNFKKKKKTRPVRVSESEQ